MTEARPVTSHRTAAASAIQTLAALGVDTVFGIPGVHNQGLYDALMDQHAVRSVVVRHEQGAAFMADGYARASGRVGVCFVITGPGLTNAATAIAEAYADAIPVVCLATCYAGLPTRGRRLHDLKDQAMVVAGIAKAGLRVRDPGDLPAVLVEAFRLATTGRPGPVVVEVPIEHLDMAVGSAAPAIAQPAPPDPGMTMTPPEGPAPVVVVGGGCVDAAEQVKVLAERLDAPVVCTSAGKGVLPDDHPLAVGAWLKADAVRQLLASADPLILLGTEWSPTDLGDHDVTLPDRVVRVDLDPDLQVDGTLHVRADVAATLEAWSAALGQRGTRPASTGRSRAQQTRTSAGAEKRRWTEQALAVLGALRASLDRDAVLVQDMTTIAYAAIERFPSYAPRTFLFPRGFGTLGYGLPAAIGARFALPASRQVVALCGDGGVLFTSEELSTAVRHRLNLPVVLWNNGAFDAIRATRMATYRRSVDDDLTNPDFLELASAYGCHGTRVRSPAEMGTALGQAFARDLPTLIDVVAGEG